VQEPQGEFNASVRQSLVEALLPDAAVELSEIVKMPMLVPGSLGEANRRAHDAETNIAWRRAKVRHAVDLIQYQHRLQSAFKFR
jgi:hypothetical protein